MSGKTGFDKFLSKQFNEGVKIATPATDNEQRVRETREEKSREEDNIRSKEERKKISVSQTRRRGRPAREKGENEAATESLYLNLDRELKRKLTEVKYKTYKSSLKDVAVEAFLDICKKYDVE